MNKLLVTLLLFAQSMYAFATDQNSCEAAGGAFLTGRVVSAPKFASADKYLQGIALTHTHVHVMSDQDGNIYDVAIDNVFAVDYIKNSNTIPRSLAALTNNVRLELCGELYNNGTGIGIHWVHNNCNEKPNSITPDGWVKTIDSNGVVGNNLERNQAYCYLWQ